MRIRDLFLILDNSFPRFKESQGPITANRTIKFDTSIPNQGTIDLNVEKIIIF